MASVKTFDTEESAFTDPPVDDHGDQAVTAPVEPDAETGPDSSGSGDANQDTEDEFDYDRDRLSELRALLRQNRAAIAEAPPAVVPQISREIRAIVVEIEEVEDAMPEANAGSPLDEVTRRRAQKAG